MQKPLEIRFEGIDPSDFIEKRVADEVSKLEQFFDKIISIRVVIDKPHKGKHKGNLYGVKVYIALPGNNFVTIDKNPGDINAHEDVYVAIRDSFNAAKRQMQDTVRKMQGKVKTH